MFECCTIIEQKDRKTGSTICQRRWTSTTVGLVNSKNTGCSLVIQPTHDEALITLPLKPGLQIFQNFKHEGKLTICTPGKQHQVMLRAAAPSSLQLFLDVLQGRKPLPQKHAMPKSPFAKPALASPGERVRVKGATSRVNSKMSASPLSINHEKKKSRLFSPECTGGRSFQNVPLKYAEDVKKKLFESSEFSDCRESQSKTQTQMAKHSTPLQKVTLVEGQDLGPEQEQALRFVLQGKNIFITGGAGTGKSLVVKLILRYAAKRHQKPGQVVATATTALAACHMNGCTIHRFAGIGYGCQNKADAVKAVLKKASAVKRWQTVKVLIIDEISMLDGDLFDTLECIAREARGNNAPFGGVKLVLAGDFFQLPPVSKMGEERLFCFQAKSWKTCVQETVELKKVYRQLDGNFVSFLNKLRWGEPDESLRSMLQSLVGKRLATPAGILETKLLSHKKDVEQINTKCLAELSGDCICFEAKDTFLVGSGQSLLKQLDESCPAQKLIRLKIGAQVILIKSLSLAKGLVNGARGIVTGFPSNKKSVMVKFISGLEQEIGYKQWKVFCGVQEVCSRSQIPLELGWALSIHKSQGMSLDCVAVSLMHIFEYGQAYVALSRARTLEGLAILDGVSPKCFAVNPEVKDFYKKIRS